MIVPGEVHVDVRFEHQRLEVEQRLRGDGRGTKEIMQPCLIHLTVISLVPHLCFGGDRPAIRAETPCDR